MPCDWASAVSSAQTDAAQVPPCINVGEGREAPPDLPPPSTTVAPHQLCALTVFPPLWTIQVAARMDVPEMTLEENPTRLLNDKYTEFYFLIVFLPSGLFLE